MLTKAMSIYINELVYELKQRNVNVTTLSLGEAFFDLPKPTFENYEVDDLVHYTSSRGHPKLLTTLQEYYQNVHHAEVNQQELMVTAGSKIAIYMALLYSIGGAKNKVAVLEPAWLSYQEQVSLAHGEPVNFGQYSTLEEVIKNLSSDFCAILINNPNNPSGFTYDQTELDQLFRACQSLKINVIIDEAYSEFVPAESRFQSCSRIIRNYDNVIVVSSLSKNMGMSGFRIGYLVSNSQITDQIVKYNQHLITCAPTILQVYIADHFFEILKQTSEQIKDIVMLRSEVLNYCNEKDLNVLDGDSTFYFMLELKNVEDVFDFSLNLLLTDNISVVPGVAYGDSCKSFVRISVGTETLKNIKSAIDLINYRADKGWNTNKTTSCKLDELQLPYYD